LGDYVDKQTKEFHQCLGCGAILSKYSENSTDSSCLNINCPFSGIYCLDESWDISYGQKTINRQREVIGKLKETTKELISFIDFCGCECQEMHKSEFRSDRCDMVKRSRKILDEIETVLKGEK